MTETEYFGHLEMRVSREFAGMRDRRLRSMWCDGFLPEHFVVTRSGSHVSGRVWIDDGRTGQTLWNFVVLLGRSRVQRAEVEWAKLLPAEDTTGWVFMDFERQFLKVKLSAAHPERASAPT